MAQLKPNSLFMVGINPDSDLVFIEKVQLPLSKKDPTARFTIIHHDLLDHFNGHERLTVRALANLVFRTSLETLCFDIILFLIDIVVDVSPKGVIKMLGTHGLPPHNKILSVAIDPS